MEKKKTIENAYKDYMRSKKVKAGKVFLTKDGILIEQFTSKNSASQEGDHS